MNDISLYSLKVLNNRAFVENKKIILHFVLGLYKQNEGLINKKEFLKEFDIKLNILGSLEIDVLIAMFNYDNEKTGFIDIDVKIFDEDYKKIIYRHYADYTMFKEYQDLFKLNTKTGELIFSKNEIS